jgi:hypothetical protein
MAKAPEAKAIPGTSDSAQSNGNSGEIYYFAYGANMNKKQIKEICSSPRVVDVAKLADHQLAFFGHSAVWDGAEETVIPASGHEVWGVVYDLNSRDRDHLDDAQDARMDGSGACFHSPASVTSPDGKRYAVLLYKAAGHGVAHGAEQKPSREYLDFIVAGAVDHKLPADYVEALRAVDSTKAKYAVPRQKKSLRGVATGDGCSQCGDADAAGAAPNQIINISLGSPRSHS